MKPWIAGALCLAVATSVHVIGQGKDQTEQCDRVSSLAEQVMQDRQAGTSKDSLLNRLGQASTTRRLIDMAFEQPRYHTQTMQDRARQEFSLSYYRDCLQRADS
ncbi:hypothetical protein RSO41_13565 [Halomonas sp. I1]|uniref:hypothetical protein n=1 Tax=Halomonas sp. I1 TaxID=393536 RepID=UPI0028DEBE00|nr:hypothetical protein [Halomonas sp. I1]MDT8895680.1 hypothetical protein [Halomonas sp. I1]